MVEFPDDLIRDILSRLPVKPLLRFRCVSKHWCALINSNHFVKQHVNNSVIKKSNHTLILHQYHLNTLRSVGLYSPDRALNFLQPVNLNHRVTKLLGSYNGLLCLSSYDGSDDVIIIWNPGTRKHVKLPTVNLKKPFRNDLEVMDIMYGFGYNSVSDDYIVLMLIQFSKGRDRNISYCSQANVYSQRSNLWRKIWNFPNYQISEKQARSVLACGALHWFIIVEGDSEIEFETLVASFDIATEKCRIITQPDFCDHEELSLMLSEFNVFLSFSCSYYEVGVVDVWVMKDYGVTESWTKIITIGSEIITSFEHLIILAYLEAGDEVLLMVNFVKFLWYNPEKKTIKLVDVGGFPEPIYPVICLESLVSLGEKAQNDENRGGKNDEAKKERKEKFLSVGFKLVL